MAILRVQTIGYSYDTINHPEPFYDFQTPQQWFDANAGDLVSSGLICVGVMTGGEAISGINKRPSVDNGLYTTRMYASGVPALIMDASKCNTDSEHFYVLRGHDYNLDSNFTKSSSNNTVVPNSILTYFNTTVNLTTYSLSYHIKVDDSPCAVSGNVPYTRFENLVIFASTRQKPVISPGSDETAAESSVTTAYLSQCAQMAGVIITSGTIDGCRISVINSQYDTPTSSFTNAYGIFAHDSTIIRNTLIDTVYAKADWTTSGLLRGCTARAIGINIEHTGATKQIQLYNNTVKLASSVIRGLNFGGNSFGYGIYSLSPDISDSIYNNIVLQSKSSINGDPNAGTKQNYYLNGAYNAKCNLSQDNSAIGFNSGPNIEPSSLCYDYNASISGYSQDGWFSCFRTSSGTYLGYLLRSDSPYASSGFNLYNNVSGYIGRQFSWDIEGQPRGNSWSIGADQVGYGININIPEGCTLYLNATPSTSGTTTNNVPLVCQNNLALTSGVNLYSSGLGTLSSSVPLFMKQGSGVSDGSNNFNLFLKTFESTTLNDNNVVPLYISSLSGTTNRTFPLVLGAQGVATGSMNLVIPGGGPILVNTSTPLYIENKILASGNNSFNLFLQTNPIPTGTVSLFLSNSYGHSSGNVKLFIEARGNTSGSMNLVMLGPSRDTIFGQTPLYIDASHSFSGIPLVMSGGQRQSSSNFNLMVNAGGPFTSINTSTTLFSRGSTYQGMSAGKTLYLNANKERASFNLFINSPSSVYVTGPLNLYLGNSAPKASYSVYLALANNYIGSGKPLFIKGGSYSLIDDGSNDNYKIKQDTMNLFINRANEANKVDMYIKGGIFSPVNNYITAKIAGCSGYANNNVTLAMLGAIPKNSGIYLYTHGYTSGLFEII